MSARRAEEESARFRLTAANGRLRAALVAHDGEVERYRSLPSSSEAEMTWADLNGELARAAMAAATVESARLQAAARQAQVECRSRDWTDAARRVAILERLAERRHQEWRVSSDRQEAVEVNDTVATLWALDRARAVGPDTAGRLV